MATTWIVISFIATVVLAGTTFAILSQGGSAPLAALFGGLTVGSAWVLTESFKFQEKK